MDFLRGIIHNIDPRNIMGAINAINSQGNIQQHPQQYHFVRGGIRPINDSGNMCNTLTNNKGKVEIIRDIDYDNDD